MKPIHTNEQNTSKTSIEVKKIEFGRLIGPEADFWPCLGPFLVHLKKSSPWVQKTQLKLEFLAKNGIFQLNLGLLAKIQAQIDLFLLKHSLLLHYIIPNRNPGFIR